jgi:hypothetical protein|tara:strand:- start:213 stop:1088 length:876 start_codon:yes stop_codon:yes gene_type:complete
MKKKLENIVPDIYKALAPLAKGNGLELSDQMVEEFGEDMKEALRGWAKKQPKTKDALRMSNIGKPARQLWYNKHSKSTKKDLESSLVIKFLYGHLLEALVVFFVKLSGHEITDQQKEVNVSGIKGHMDCKIDGEVVDIKSTSGFAFNKFRNGTLPEQDSFGYMAQLAGYEEAEGTDKGGFLAINKETGELWMFRPDEFDKPNIKSKIKGLKASLKKLEPPELCYQPIAEGVKGNFKLPKECNWCEYKMECHSDSNKGKGLRVFDYARGPSFFTEVMVEPKVKEITNEWKKK